MFGKPRPLEPPDRVQSMRKPRGDMVDHPERGERIVLNMYPQRPLVRNIGGSRSMSPPDPMGGHRIYLSIMSHKETRCSSLELSENLYSVSMLEAMASQ